MDDLVREKTNATPAIRFSGSAGVLSIEGESYPENSVEFYRPIVSWVDRFFASHAGPTTLNVTLTYLNTGSTKCMMDILDACEEAFGAGREVVINWYYDPENDRALEMAEEFKGEVTLPFNIIPMGA